MKITAQKIAESLPSSQEFIILEGPFTGKKIKFDHLQTEPLWILTGHLENAAEIKVGNATVEFETIEKVSDAQNS